MLWQHDFLNSGFYEPIKQLVFSRLSQRDVLNLSQVSTEQNNLVFEYKKSDQYKAISIAYTNERNKCDEVLELYCPGSEEYNRLNKIVYNQETMQWNSNANVWSKVLWILITDNVSNIDEEHLYEVITELDQLIQTPDVTIVMQSLFKTIIMLAYISGNMDFDSLTGDMQELNKEKASYFNMQGVVLLTKYFCGLDLRFANFSYAELSDVNFRDANLYGSTFYEVMGNIDFQSANLKESSFRNAYLSLCDFTCANVDNMSFNKTRVESCFGISPSNIPGVIDVDQRALKRSFVHILQSIRIFSHNQNNDEDSYDSMEEKRPFKRLKK